MLKPPCHIDGTINGSIVTYIKNCGLRGILADCHADLDADIPNTPLRGSVQIDFKLATPGIALVIDVIGLLDFDVIFRTNHCTFFIDINTDGLFGSATESLPAHLCRQLQLEEPTVTTEYRRVLHQQFIHHNFPIGSRKK
jgi:hypothetical protein